MHITPGQSADIAAAEDAIKLTEARPRELPADKGHDADDRQVELLIRGVRPVFPWRSTRRKRGRPG